MHTRTRSDPDPTDPRYADVLARIECWHAEAADDRLIGHRGGGIVTRIRNAAGDRLVDLGRAIAARPEPRRRTVTR